MTGPSVRGRPHAGHAASGIVSLVLLLVTIPVLPPIPPFGSSADEIASFYTEYEFRGYLYQFLAGLALLATLWFFAYLYTRLRRENPDSPLPVVMMAAASAWVAVDVVYLGLFQVFSVWAGQPETHPMLRALSDAYVLGFMFSVLPAGVAVVAAASGMRPEAGWPRWLRWLAGLAVVVQVLGCVPLFDPGGPLPAGGLITYASVFMVVLWACLAGVTALRSENARDGRAEEAYSEV